MLAKAYVEITNRCNLRCAFCPGTKRAPRDMSAEEFQQLAPQLRELTRFVYFHVMGEPLLHPQLTEFLAIAQVHDLRVILTTNGTLLNARAAQLLSAPALHKVNVSLHSFEANSAIAPDAYIRDCAHFAQQAGEAGILCSLRLWNLDGAQPGLRQMNSQILALLHAQFPEPWAQNTRGYRLASRIFLEWGERFEWPEKDAQEHGAAGFCYALRDQVGILCDGSVVPCCLDHEGELTLGNAFQTSLHEIITAPRSREIYDGFSRRYRAAELCRHCGYAERFSLSSKETR